MKMRKGDEDGAITYSRHRKNDPHGGYIIRPGTICSRGDMEC